MSFWSSFKIIVIFLIILGFFTVKSYGCKCGGEESVEEGINRLSSVVVGTIISKELITIQDSSTTNSFRKDNRASDKHVYFISFYKFDLAIQKVFKGEYRKDTIHIYTGKGHGDCGFNFIVGNKYIIYGSMESYFSTINPSLNYPKGTDILWTNICSRTTLFNRSEIEEIEKYKKS